MKFDIRTETFTPEHPVFLAGFGARTRKSDGVLDELYVQTVLLEDDAGKRLLLIALDALGCDRSFMRGIRQSLFNAYGLREDELIVNFSHTHASVFLTGEDGDRRGHYSIGQDQWPDKAEDLDFTEDISFYRGLRDRLLRMTGQCMAGLREGELQHGAGTTGIGVYRRVRTEKGTVMAPNYERAFDQSLHVLKLIDLSGKTVAVLFSCACHPTTMGSDNNRLSAEYPGVARRYIESLVPGATAVFIQGCAADIKPLQSANGSKFHSCTPDEMRNVGHQLGEEVGGLLQQGSFSSIDGVFRAFSSDLHIPVLASPIGYFEQRAADPSTGEYERKALLRLIEAMRRGAERRHLEQNVTVWRIGERFVLAALEHEVANDYAARLKDRLEAEGLVPLIAAYTNGVMTYVPTADMLSEGGYEAGHYIYCSLPGPLTSSVDRLICSRVVEMAGKL